MNGRPSARSERRATSTERAASGWRATGGWHPFFGHPFFGPEELGAEGLPASRRIEVGDLQLHVSPLYFAPVLLVDPDGRVSRFPRCLARYRADDGREGLGWVEWNQPQLG